MHAICASEKQNMQDNICLTQNEIQILIKNKWEPIFMFCFENNKENEYCFSKTTVHASHT